MAVTTACIVESPSNGGGTDNGNQDSGKQNTENQDNEDQDDIQDKKSFSIVFKNHDGSVLYVATVEEGEPILYNGDTPVKSGEGFTYTFVGWTNYGVFSLTTTTCTVAADGVVHTNNGTVSGCKNYGGALQ
jgi:hypothetical protein